MSSKSLTLALLIIFNYGCAHSYDVAKTDASADPRKVTVEATPEPVERMPASVSVESNSQLSPDDTASHVDAEIQQVVDEIQAEETTNEDCRSVTFAKKYSCLRKTKGK